jgi:hypothetical protein
LNRNRQGWQMTDRPTELELLRQDHERLKVAANPHCGMCRDTGLGWLRGGSLEVKPCRCEAGRRRALDDLARGVEGSGE